MFEPGDIHGESGKRAYSKHISEMFACLCC